MLKGRRFGFPDEHGLSKGEHFGFTYGRGYFSGGGYARKKDSAYSLGFLSSYCKPCHRHFGATTR